jgi:hypothetical protein
LSLVNRHPLWLGIVSLGGVVETGGLEKLKSPVCYLTQNPTKSLCKPSDSTSFNFLEFADFFVFCAGFSGNLVTGCNFLILAHMIVTRSTLAARFDRQFPDVEKSTKI